MNALRKAIAAVVAVTVAILAIGFAMADSTPAPVPEEPAPTYQLVLDCSNAKQMHDHGLPTKADCMEWHVHGQWGYYDGGVLHAHDVLPGSAKVWDELYGIEDNPTFDKRS